MPRWPRRQTFQFLLRLCALLLLCFPGERATLTH
uniref:Uncharacterized protein n=1 Tax=Picea glauca TaxID=3330 RepID=A0A117NGM4_PICGL|nr:hypothetical protein ABT39_MTgene6020 [Picea glauca]